MSGFIVEFDRIDWALLRRQKGWLLDRCRFPQDRPYAEGIVNLFDYIQDAAEQQGEQVVWLSEEDTDVYAGPMD